MSVLIRGMEMPQKCGQCKLFHAEHPMYCTASEGHRTVGAPYGMPRPDWCPLVDVKTMVDVWNYLKEQIGVTIDECTRKNFCVDCDDSDCLLAGITEADCPKWKCDNPTMNCETCEFLKEYKKGVTE